MFAKALKGQNIEELLSSIASAPVGGAAAGPAAGAAAEKAAPVEESKYIFADLIAIQRKRKKKLPT